MYSSSAANRLQGLGLKQVAWLLLAGDKILTYRKPASFSPIIVVNKSPARKHPPPSSLGTKLIYLLHSCYIAHRQPMEQWGEPAVTYTGISSYLHEFTVRETTKPHAGPREPLLYSNSWLYLWNENCLCCTIATNLFFFSSFLCKWKNISLDKKQFLFIRNWCRSALCWDTCYHF